MLCNIAKKIKKHFTNLFKMPNFIFKRLAQFECRAFLLPIIRKDGVPPMTERQKKFAEYYAQCGNAAESARKAGYSKNYAEHRTDEMLRKVEIADYIRELTEAAQTARIMTARERQAILSDIAKDKQNELSDRIRAIDTLNKMTGEYTQKVSIDGDVGVKIVDDC